MCKHEEWKIDGVIRFSWDSLCLIGPLHCRFTSGESVVLFKSKGKSQGGPDVHLSGMTQLTGKSSSQTFMLKLLKVMIDLRGTARTSLRTKSSKCIRRWYL